MALIDFDTSLLSYTLPVPDLNSAIYTRDPGFIWWEVIFLDYILGAGNYRLVLIFYDNCIAGDHLMKYFGCYLLSEHT